MRNWRRFPERFSSILHFEQAVIDLTDLHATTDEITLRTGALRAERAWRVGYAYPADRARTANNLKSEPPQNGQRRRPKAPPRVLKPVCPRLYLLASAPPSRRPINAAAMRAIDAAAHRGAELRCR